MGKKVITAHAGNQPFQLSSSLLVVNIIQGLVGINCKVDGDANDAP